MLQREPASVWKRATWIMGRDAEPSRKKNLVGFKSQACDPAKGMFVARERRKRQPCGRCGQGLRPMDSRRNARLCRDRSGHVACAYCMRQQSDDAGGFIRFRTWLVRYAPVQETVKQNDVPMGVLSR